MHEILKQNLTSYLAASRVGLNGFVQEKLWKKNIKGKAEAILKKMRKNIWVLENELLMRFNINYTISS